MQGGNSNDQLGYKLHQPLCGSLNDVSLEGSRALLVTRKNHSLTFRLCFFTFLVFLFFSFFFLFFLQFLILKVVKWTLSASFFIRTVSFALKHFSR